MVKFSIDSAKLNNILKTVIKGFQQKEDGSYIYLEVSDDNLTIVSRCRSAYFEGQVPISDVATDEENKVFYVDGETLRQLASIFPSVSMEINFELNQNRVFKISWPANSFKLPITSDFQASKRPVVKELGSIDGAQFTGAIADLMKIVESDSAAQNHQISCLHLTIDGQVASLMATDKYALGVIQSDFTPTEEDLKFTGLIRNAQAALLHKKCLPGEILSIVESGDGMIGYIDNDNIVSLVSLVSLPPLSWAAFKNAGGGDQKITVNKDNLKTAIDTVAKLSFDGSSIMFAVDKEKSILHVSTISGNVVDVAIIDAEEIEADCRFNFNLNVISEALAPAPNTHIRFEWNEQYGQADKKVAMMKLTPVDLNNKPTDNILLYAVTDKLMDEV